MLTVVPDVAGARPADGQPSSLIDQIVRDGARQMLAAALQAEVAAYIGQFAGLRAEDGRRMVVRNGTAGPRTVLTSAGAVQVTAPRVNDTRADPATGERKRFSSAILPPWARKTPQAARCCRCCTCTACRRGTSCPRSGSSSARMPGCQPRQ
jgi:Transposase, Mutator family